MFADIFYPTFTHPNNHHFSVFYTEKKPKLFGGLCPHPHQGINLDLGRGGGLQPLPRPPAAIVFGFCKNQCAYIFSVLLYYPLTYTIKV